jgi:hypothetical protein
MGILIKCIEINMRYWPPSVLQSAPHTQSEIAKVHQFCEEVEKLAKKIPKFGCSVTIKEERERIPD